MKGEFSLAVHALVYLNHRQCCLSSEEIAVNTCTNPARVRKVLAKLKKTSLISTKEGVDGGYTFLLNASDVKLEQVARALGTQFVGVAWHSGNQDMDCLVASGMAAVMDSIYSDLNANCLEKLQKISLADIDKMIFG